MDINLSVATQNLPIPEVLKRNIQLDMLRLDAIHPSISGNKWFKLKEQIATYKAHKYDALLTFGGGFSNHLSATAAACNYYNIPCIGIVRGEELHNNSNTTLQFCTDQGMHLSFIDRASYKNKSDADFHKNLLSKFGNVFIVPEGGNNIDGRIGAASIVAHFKENYDYVIVSVGTGTTFLGISDALSANTKLVGYIPMKQGENYAATYTTAHPKWQLIDTYHFGGFGKYTNELLEFMSCFYKNFNIPLDIVYTGKMMFGLINDISLGWYDNGSKILCIHSGGLQGNNSIGTLLGY